MSKVRVTLTIGEGVLERVDEAAWRCRLSRSAFVEDVLECSGRLVAEEAVGSVTPYPPRLHPKNAEEEAMDALLEPFDA